MRPEGPINIAIVANCQARPIASILEKLNPHVKVGSLVITHLAKDAEKDAILENLRRADFVFAQAVQDSYPIHFVRTSNLRAELAERLVTWPNIFFKGQCADLCYLTTSTGQRILGPLGEYQSRPIYDAWRSGETVAATIAQLLNGGPWADKLPQIVENSFADLKAREKGLDTAISSRVETQWRERRLFYTFNHPVRYLLREAAVSLLDRIEVASDAERDDETSEPLDRIIPALLPPAIEALDLRLPVNLSTKGCKIALGPEVQLTRESLRYSVEDLVAESFRCLDAQIQPESTLRIT